MGKGRLSGAERPGLGLQSCPVFYPSEKEFQDPIRYIASVRELAEHYGICQIVPPLSWNPPFVLDREKFKFTTKVQAIHQLQERPGAHDADTFKLEYKRFMKRTGLVLPNWPSWEGEELDLCKLFNVVKRKGGYERVCQERKWGELARFMKPEDKDSVSSTAAPNLRHMFRKYLLSYESYNPADYDDTDSDDEDRPKPRAQSSKAGVATGRMLTGGRPKAGRMGAARPHVKQEQTTTKADLQAASVLMGFEVAKPAVPPAPKRPKLEKGPPPKGVGEEEGFKDQKCELCSGAGNEDKMLLCDRCDCGYHTFCISPPLEEVPEGNWYCSRCLSSEDDTFGFAQGQEYTLGAFQRMADKFKKGWFEGVSKGPSPAQVEAEFWRVVEQSDEPVEVLYGSDLDTSIYGSGFPKLKDVGSPKADGTWNQYAEAGWNLNNMPRHDGSVLQCIDDQIPGVMVPWLYVGMMFSTFCWHYEDHCLYSINYLHWGEPKSWYAVPAHAGEAFEEVMKKTFPDMFEAQPDLLFQLVTMLNPTVLHEQGVPVYTTLQVPKSFVVTFPRSYHAGFNHGFNCAEAVNFAPADWLPWGGYSVERYRLFRKNAILSHDELLCVIARSQKAVDPYTAAWLQEELIRIIASEKEEREELWAEGCTQSSRLPEHAKPDRIGEEEDPECAICHYFLYLSAVECSCRPGQLACLQHAAHLCECQQPSKRRLLYRYSLAELANLLARLSSDFDNQIELSEHQLFESEASENSSGSLKRRAESEPLEVDSKEVKRAKGLTPCSAGTGSSARRKSLEAEESLDGSSRKKVQGKMFSFAELAEQWCYKVRLSARRSPTLKMFKEWLEEADQFLWGAHDVDQVRSIVSQLQAAQLWSEDLSGAVASSKKPLLPRLEELQRRAHPRPPLQDPNYKILLERLAWGRDLAVRVGEAFKQQPPPEMETLQALLNEAQKGPVELVQTKRLRDAIIAGQTWASSVRKVLPGLFFQLRVQSKVAELDTLLALQKEGSALPLTMAAEMKALEESITKCREWSVKAQQLLAREPRLQEVEELLEAAAALPARVPELSTLTSRAQKAQSWLQRARQILSPPGPPEGGQRKSGASGKVLALGDNGPQTAGAAEKEVKTSNNGPKKAGATETGPGLGDNEPPKVEALGKSTLKVMNELLREAKGLEVSVDEVALLQAEIQKQMWVDAARKALTSHGPIKAIEDLILEAERITVDDRVLTDLKQAAESAKAWESKADKLLREGGSLEDYQDAAKSLAMLKVRVTQSKPITHALQKARDWLEKVQPFLKGRSKRAAESTPPVKWGTLQAWLLESARFTIALPEVEHLKSRLADISTWRCQASDLLSNLPDPGGVPEEGFTSRLKDLIEEGLGFGAELKPQLESLERLLAAKLWNEEAQEVVDNRRPLETVESLIAGAADLAVDPNCLAAVNRIANTGKEWKARASAFLTRHGKRLDESQLLKLIEDAKELPCEVSGDLSKLEQALANHRLWVGRVQKALDKEAKEAGNTTTKAELEKLKRAGEASLLRSAELKALEEAISAVDAWESKLKKALAKKGNVHERTLAALLIQVRLSAEVALEELEAGASGRASQRFCLCQVATEEEGKPMILCDSCNVWYHMACVQVTPQQAQELKRYSCPFCKALTTATLDISAAVYEKMYSSKRPSLGTLEELIVSSKALPCMPPIATTLSIVVNRAAQFGSRAKELLEEAKHCGDLQRAKKSLQALVATLRAAKAMEVLIPGLEEAILVVFAEQAWRTRLQKGLQGGKHLRTQLTKWIKEGTALGVRSEDELMHKLKERESLVNDWVSRARQVCKDKGAMEVASVKALISEGEQLPAVLEKELQALRERCVLYCICLKPYDAERAMIACDRCQEWFHFGCLGMEEPQGQEKPSVEIESFLCPKCDQVEKERLRILAEKRAAAEIRRRLKQEEDRQRQQEERERLEILQCEEKVHLDSSPDWEALGDCANDVFEGGEPLEVLEGGFGRGKKWAPGTAVPAKGLRRSRKGRVSAAPNWRSLGWLEHACQIAAEVDLCEEAGEVEEVAPSEVGKPQVLRMDEESPEGSVGVAGHDREGEVESKAIVEAKRPMRRTAGLHRGYNEYIL